MRFSTGPVEVPPSGPVAAFAFATTPGTELRPSFVAIGLMRTLLLLGLATQGLSLQLPARPRLRKPQARPASEAYQLLSYRAFGLFVPLWIAFSTENAEALTATPSPGADELQISSAQWRAREKDRAEAAKAKMYEERSAADATRAREREARRAAVEARRLEAGREASGAADGGARGADGACCGDFEDVKCLACRAGIELKAFCKLNKHVHGC